MPKKLITCGLLLGVLVATYYGCSILNQPKGLAASSKTRLELSNREDMDPSSSAMISSYPAYEESGRMPAYIAELSPSRDAALRRLLVDVEQGSMESFYALRLVLTRCNAVEFAKAAYAKSPPSAQQLEMLRKLEGFCGADSDLVSRAEEVEQSEEKYLEIMRKRGDIHAQAISDLKYSLYSSDIKVRAAASEKVVGALREDIGPLQKMQLIRSLMVYGGRESGLISEVDSMVFSQYHDESYRAKVQESAMQLYGCSAGNYCGANASYQEGYCLVFDICAPQASVQDFLRNNYLSKDEYGKAMAYLDGLNKMIAK